MRGQPLEDRGSGVPGGHRGRDRHEPPRTHDRELGIGAGLHGVRDAVTRAHLTDARPHCVDRAGRLLAEHARKRTGVLALAAVDVDEVHADELDPHPRLAGAGLGHGHLFELEHPRAAIFAHHHSLHETPLSSSRSMVSGALPS
jgi:hypothetical protein